MLLKKRNRPDGEIPSASLADMAFLLLIFFLVTTTIDVDSGIGLVLPPPADPNTPPPPVKERNMLKILINSSGNVLINDQPSDMADVKEKVYQFITNKGQDPNLSESPQKAVVSLKTDRQTTYNTYIELLDRVKGAYNEARNDRSRQVFGVAFEKLPDSKQKEIKDYYPEKISEAEPDKGAQK